MRPHVLFVIGPALGHVGRSLRVIEQLRPHARVSVVGTKAGPWLELLGPDVEVPANPIKDHELHRYIEPTVDALRPDVVCIDNDGMKWALLRLDDVATVMLTNAFLTPVWGEVETTQLQSFAARFDTNECRVERGLVPLKTPKTLYAADDTILADPIGLLPPSLPPRFHAIGPIAWDPSAPLSGELSSNQRRLAASFGSSGRVAPRPEDVERLRRLLDCAHVAWVGGHPGEVEDEYQVEVHNAPFSAICRSAPIALTQGGAGSTYLALAAGVPVVVQPTHRNHTLLGETLAAAGVGCLLSDLLLLDNDQILDTVSSMRDRLATLPISRAEGEPAALAASIILRRAEAGREKLGPLSLGTAEEVTGLQFCRDGAADLVHVTDPTLARSPATALDIRRVQPTGGRLMIHGSQGQDADISPPGYERVCVRKRYGRWFARLPAPLRIAIGKLLPSAVRTVEVELRAKVPDEALLAAATPHRRLFVHIGTHGTDTTHFQEYLCDNHTALRRLGVHYHRDRELNAVGLPSLPLAVIRPDLDMTIRNQFPFALLSEAREALSAGLQEAFSSAIPTMLVSHEALSFARHVEEVERLRDLTASREVVVLVTLRDKSAFLESYRTEMDQTRPIPLIARKMARRHRTSVRYVEDDSWLLDYGALLGVYESVFGPDQVIRLDYEHEMAQRGSIIPALLEECGIEPSRLPDSRESGDTGKG